MREAEVTRRRAPVDWDDLEMALTSHVDERACYLDLRTGKLHMVHCDPFGHEDHELSEEEVDAGLAAGDLASIEPLPSSEEYGWMVEFAALVSEPRLRDRLEVALDGRGAFRRFKNVLLDAPEERERWFAFRDGRVREAMQRWLEDHEIEPTKVPTRGRRVKGLGIGSAGDEDMPVANRQSVSLTGNPFVDTGLAVIAVLAKLPNVQDLSVGAMHKVHGNGRKLASWNSSLKSFTMVLTNNSLLTNPSIENGGKRQHAYADIVSGLLGKIGGDEISYRCEACGAPRSVDFDALCREALSETGIKDQTRFVGRDWFPLSGSLGSDAQALPVASRPVHLCAKCLFAIHYLPLGLILLDGRLSAFQSTSIGFWYELVQDIVNEMQSRIAAGLFDTLGAKEGSRAVVKRLLGLFERLQKAGRFGEIPPGTVLHVWRFSNSGASPKCDIEEIPNLGLVFLWEAVRKGLRQEIENLVGAEGRGERPLFRCITEGRDYSGLYPRGKKPSASPKLFALYQTQVCGRSPEVLGIAHTLARRASEGVRPRDLKRLQREEAFSEPAVRNQFRALMVRLAQDGKFRLDNYLGLFPSRDDATGVAVRFDGWVTIRYYLHHSGDADYPSNLASDRTAHEAPELPGLGMIRYYATQIIRNCVDERGRERFRTEVLGRMGRGEISIAWLRRQFLGLAERYSGFTFGQWERLCRNEGGHLSVSELLFQMRLLWTEWMRASSLPGVVNVPEWNQDSGLPHAVECLLREFFSDYVAQRGLNRLRQDVLARLRRREIGLPWLAQRLTQGRGRASVWPSLLENEWDDSLKDEEGRPWARERLFLMHLMLANLYREATV